MKSSYIYQATVVRIIDGDTLVFDLDLGCSVTVRKTIRLVGINAPEMSTPAGLLSKTFLNTQLVIGQQYVVQTFLDKNDKYGRLLGNVFVGSESVADRMVFSGYAVLKTY